MTENLRIPPHSAEAERGLLGCCLIEEARESVEILIEEGVKPDQFYVERHGVVYSAILEIYEKGQPIDEIALMEHLKAGDKLEEIGGLSTIYELQAAVETNSHAKYYAGIVKEKSTLRKLIRELRMALEMAFEENECKTLLASFESRVRNLSDEASNEETVRTSKEVCKQIASEVAAKLQDPDAGKEKVVETHLRELNAMFDVGGFSPPEMVVVGARPSVGKTAFAGNLMEHAADTESKAVMMFSYEMLAGQVMARIAASKAGISAKKIRKPTSMTGTDQQALSKALKELQNADLWIDDDSGNTILDIRAKCLRKATRLQRQGKRLGMVVIDYLQLIPATDTKLQRREHIGEVSRGIKRLAKELDCPVVVLSQLNRDSTKNERRPNMADIRESGEIEQDADVIILLHRVKNEQPDNWIKPEIEHIELIVEKQRDGETGTVNANFVRRYTRFEDFTR